MTRVEESVWAAVFAREMDKLGFNIVDNARECANTADRTIIIMRRMEGKYNALHPTDILEREREERS